MSGGMKYDSGKHDWWGDHRQLLKYVVCGPRGSITCQVLEQLIDMGPLTFERELAGLRALQILYPSLSDQYEAIGKVLEFGERKYARNSWQSVPDAYRRYWSAAVRHLIDDEFVPYGPNHIDADSGLPTWAHCATNIEFLLRLEYPNV